MARTLTRKFTNRFPGDGGQWRGYYKDLADAGLTPDVKTGISHAPAPADVAALLGTDGDVLQRARIMGETGGTTYQLATSYFAPAVVAAIPRLAEQDTGPGGMYALMEEHHSLRQDEHLSTPVATAEEAHALGLREGDRVIRSVRITRSETDGTVLEVTVAAMNPDLNVIEFAN